MAHVGPERALAALLRTLPCLAGFRLAVDARRRDAVIGRHGATIVGSAFQPWRRAADGAVLAWEAYARSRSSRGEDLSPWQLLADAAVDGELVALDRLCRTVHVLNHFVAGRAPGPLVLNVDARLCAAVPDGHGSFFAEVLAAAGVASADVVIELRAGPLPDISLLRRVVANYRRRGFGVAVNADGPIQARALAGFLLPDRVMLEAAVCAPGVLGPLVAAVAPLGIGIAVKCIETPGQLAAAREAGVDWVQGWLLDP